MARVILVLSSWSVMFFFVLFAFYLEGSRSNVGVYGSTFNCLSTFPFWPLFYFPPFSFIRFTNGLRMFLVRYPWRIRIPTFHLFPGVRI